MNDDFIIRHKQRPDPKFVERLYQTINSTSPRSNPMYKRPIFMAAIVLLLAAVLIFSFSPTARAAVEALLTFNGVTVSVDEETGKTKEKLIPGSLFVADKSLHQIGNGGA